MNRGEGRTTSAFAQVGWRFDLLGDGGSVGLSGPLLEAGIRF
jgi:hypothetical protein